MNHSLIDLDELSLRCRDRQAREYIQEAVASYKAGAFRSCIVSTWIAVVLDFLHKLKELEMTGDARAKVKLEEFEKIRAAGDASLKNALDFERNVLEVAANEFELLSPLEKEDLERLQKDRSRCAHPSMQSLEEPYQPTPELARTHLRNAVELMLQREPVQGKAAFQLICAEIKSNYFPTKTEEAKKFFESGPLKRARKGLVRNLIIGLSKAFLNDENLLDERRRLIAAITAIMDMYRGQGEETVLNEMPKVLSTVGDENLERLIIYIRRVPVAWGSTGDDVRVKLAEYLQQIPKEKAAVPVHHAMYITGLKDVALTRLPELDSTQLARMLEHERFPEYVGLALSYFPKATSFRGAEHLGRDLLLPVAEVLTPEQIKDVLEGVQENAQIWDAGGIPNILREFFEKTEHHAAATTPYWQRLMGFIDEKKVKSHLTGEYDDLEALLKGKGILP